MHTLKIFFLLNYWSKIYNVDFSKNMCALFFGWREYYIMNFLYKITK
jgi:hypothetical protein